MTGGQEIEFHKVETQDQNFSLILAQDQKFKWFLSNFGTRLKVLLILALNWKFR
jgi:hypothetical protein